MKVNKTAVGVSFVLGIATVLIYGQLVIHDKEYPTAIGVFLLSLVVFHAKPELMGNLYKPDDGEDDREKEEDT